MIDRNQPTDWDDAMKVITNGKLLRYMSKSVTVHEMDGVAIGMYKFSSKGSVILFKTIENLIKKGSVKSSISVADLSNGLYILQLRTNRGKLVNKKFLIAK